MRAPTSACADVDRVTCALTVLVERETSARETDEHVHNTAVRDASGLGLGLGLGSDVHERRHFQMRFCSQSQTRALDVLSISNKARARHVRRGDRDNPTFMMVASER